MRNAAALASKEARVWFSSPTAYAVSAGFLVICGHFFVASITAPVPEASLRGMFTPVTFALALWAPIVSMRTLAEEQRLGTLELLLTAPLRDWEIALGKFAALGAMLLGALLPTLVYAALLFRYAEPDAGPLVTGYLGLFLYGLAASSLGLFASSLTSNQIAAGLTSAVALLFLTLAGQAADLVGGAPAALLDWVALPAHYTSFVEGVVELRDAAYFVTFAALFVFLTTLSLEARRWR